MAKKIEIPYQPRPFALDKSEDNPCGFNVHSNLETHRFSVVVAHRRAGKTVFLVNHMIRMALNCTKWQPQYAYVFPLLKQAKEVAWKYLKYFTSCFADTQGYKVNESELYVEFLGRRIQLAGADNPDSLRGNYFDGVIFDEYAQIKPDVWDEIVYPAITDRDGWAVFSGTPKGMNQFYDVLKKAQIDTTGNWWWVVMNVYQSGVFNAVKIEEIKGNMRDTKFKQEYGCDFEASNEDTLIPIAAVKGATERVLQPADYESAPLVFGVDVARYGDDSCVIRPRRGLLAYHSMKYQKLGNMDFADIIAFQIEKYQPVSVFIDGGRGEGVIDRLHQLGYNQVIEVNFQSRAIDDRHYANRRAEMWDTMGKWLGHGCIPADDSLLILDLPVPLYEINKQGKLQLEAKKDIKARIGRSPDEGDGLALTFAVPVMSKNHPKVIKQKFKNNVKYDPVKAYKERVGSGVGRRRR